MDHIVRHIEKHIYQPLRLNDLADAACLSPVHFARTFREKTGYTPMKYVEIIKIKESLELLKTGELSIQEIANKIGYQSYETFSRRFQHLVSLAPSDLSYIMKVMKEETDGPLVVSGATDVNQLKLLVDEALENQTLKVTDLAKLELCTMSVNRTRSRKPEKRISYQFNPDLAGEVRDLYLK